MTLNGWVLAPVFFYLAFWAVNPLRSRLPFLRKLIHRPVPTTFHGHTLAELLSFPSPEVNTDDDDDDPRWTVEWHLLGPRISTTAFNNLPVRLVRQLSPIHRRTLACIYNLGLVWGALGLLICVGILVWEAGGTASWLSGVLRSGNGGRASARAGSQTVGGPGLKRSVIQPLIPGLTLPWSHAPMLVVAFLVGQMVHEPGHSITGALSGLSTLLVTVHLSPVFPSASVRLPSVALRNLPALEKARIGVAGCWHNLVFALGLWLASAGLGLTQRWVGGEGRVVLEVHEASPLRGVLPTGAFLTHLDDLPLGVQQGGSSTLDTTWATYLSSNEIVSQGWCVPRATFEAGPSDCCQTTRDGRQASSNICFLPLAGISSQGRCLSPDILTRPLGSGPSGRCPCPSEDDLCIDVDPFEQVLRIGYTDHSCSDDQVSWVLWQGSRSQVLQQVVTSAYLPPLFLQPSLYPLYLYLSTLGSYLLMISFTLATLNLLPFPILDGGLCLSAALEWKFPNSDTGERVYDSEEREEEGRLARREGPEGRKRRRIERGVVWTVGALGAWVLGGMVLKVALGDYE